MILTFEDIKQYIKKPKNSVFIAESRKLYNKMNMLIEGVNVAGYLNKITNFENDEQFQLRINHAKSTKHIYSNILAPVKKIFSAKGTNIDYILPEKKKQEFSLYLSKVRNKHSLRKWLKDNWLKRLHLDPNGLIFIELEQNGTNPYPTYKSINSIYDIDLNGQYIEYIIFEPDVIKYDNGDEIKIYRVVDDSKDYAISFESSLENKEQFRIIKNEEINGKIYKTINNPFKFVPAITIGDIEDINKQIKITPIHESVELAMEYIVNDSIHAIHKFLHGFPLYWEYERQCEICNGTGKIDGKPCHTCKGLGIKLRKDVSDKTTIPWPDEGEPKIAPDIAGVIEPAITTWQEYRTELDWLKIGLEFACWGTQKKEDTRNETATARYLDVQPVYDKLNEYSDSLETIYKFIINTIGGYLYKNEYKGCSVNMGRRFNIESPEEILTRYNKSRIDGTPEIILNYMIEQYVQSEFSRDNIELTKQMKLLEIEPWKHYNITDVINFNLSNDELKKKIFFGEWVTTLTDEQILTSDKDKLIDLFNTYLQIKNLKDGTSI